ncbi:hypothetical protein [Shigella phage ESh22]|jgi:hypothetical protein|nr:hypothetical protein [Shigella flexneri]EJM9728532.1 hypothetical protein [Shigella flexneri]URY12583.1 hypothetical protein [Shigella phage ESh21]URY12805.1 hypothetical protein [Shigella phage ESh22]
MLDKIFKGFKEDAPMLLWVIFLLNMFIDFKQGLMFGFMLVWLIIEILDIQFGWSTKVKNFLDNLLNKN